VSGLLKTNAPVHETDRLRGLVDVTATMMHRSLRYPLDGLVAGKYLLLDDRALHPSRLMTAL
jgi:hypothetical protein